MSEATAIVQLTPAMLAEAFWGLGSDDQVEFFAQLAKAIKADHEGGNSSAHSLGELQWLFVGSEMDKPANKEARDMLMTMAAPHYMHTLLATGNW